MSIAASAGIAVAEAGPLGSTTIYGTVGAGMPLYLSQERHWSTAAYAWVFGFVLRPFLAIGLQQHTGSRAAAFLLIPAAMACMALGVWWFTPDHAGRDLDQIGT